MDRYSLRLYFWFLRLFSFRAECIRSLLIPLPHSFCSWSILHLIIQLFSFSLFFKSICLRAELLLSLLNLVHSEVLSIPLSLWDYLLHHLLWVCLVNRYFSRELLRSTVWALFDFFKWVFRVIQYHLSLFLKSLIDTFHLDIFWFFIKILNRLVNNLRWYRLQMFLNLGGFDLFPCLKYVSSTFSDLFNRITLTRKILHFL